VNGVTVPLDVEPQIRKARTLVPLRFISEALGEQVNYDSQTKRITVETRVDAVANVVIQDVSDFGDGRDLQISFSMAPEESRVHHYRAMIVKTEG
jgi:hypothetical protein